MQLLSHLYKQAVISKNSELLRRSRAHAAVPGVLSGTVTLVCGDCCHITLSGRSAGKHALGDPYKRRGMLFPKQNCKWHSHPLGPVLILLTALPVCL